MELQETGKWAEWLNKEPEKPYWGHLASQVEAAYETQTVYPPRGELFAALRMTPPEQVRVVILGQDPYHEPGQAHGLSFSVPEGMPLLSARFGWLVGLIYLSLLPVTLKALGQCVRMVRG